MRKFQVTLTSGDKFYTDEMGRELLMGLRKQNGGPFVSIQLFNMPTDDAHASHVEVNRNEVAMIGPA